MSAVAVNVGAMMATVKLSLLHHYIESVCMHCAYILIWLGSCGCGSMLSTRDIRRSPTPSTALMFLMRKQTRCNEQARHTPCRQLYETRRGTCCNAFLREASCSRFYEVVRCRLTDRAFRSYFSRHHSDTVVRNFQRVGWLDPPWALGSLELWNAKRVKIIAGLQSRKAIFFRLIASVVSRHQHIVVVVVGSRFLGSGVISRATTTT